MNTFNPPASGSGEPAPASGDTVQFVRGTLDALTAHVAVLDGEGHILATNRAWRLFAQDNSEKRALLGEGTNYFQVCRQAAARGNADAVGLLQGAGELLAGTREFWSIEYPCHSPTEQRWFRCTLTRLAGGGPARLLAIHENITERYRAQVELAASEETFRALVNHMQIALVAHGPDTRIHFSNPRAAELLGLTPEQLSGKTALDPAWCFLRENGTPLPVEEYPVNQALRSPDGTIRDFTLGIRRPDRESPIWVQCNTVALRTPDGHVRQVLVTFGDITARKAAERQLQQSEEKFRAIFDSAGYAMDMALCGRLILVNQAHLKLFGYAAAGELIGKTIFDCIAPEERPRLQAYARLRYAGEPAPTQYETRGLRKDGSTFDLEVRISTFQYGGQTHTIGILQDVTERNRAEELLRKSEMQYSSVVSAMSEGVVVQDHTGKIQMANESAVTILGLTMDQLLGRDSDDPHWQALGEDGQPLAPEEHPASVTLRTGQPVDNFQMEVRVGEGRRALISVNSRPLVDAHKQVTGVVVTFTDITRRKTLETSLFRLAKTVEQVTEMILIADPGGKIQYANPAFEKFTGYSLAETVGHHLGRFQGDRPDQPLFQEMWNTLLRGEVWKGCFTNERKDGSRFEEEATLSPIRDERGNIINYVAVKRDVTHEKQLERQLRQSQKMEAVGTLAGGIAHDFNNLLTPVLVYANLLKSKFTGQPEATEKLSEIIQATEKARTLVQQILTFSRQRDQERRLIHLDDVIREAGKFLRSSLPAQLEMETHLAAGLPAILADANQIHQILLNLGTNAMHAMEQQPGKLTIRLDAFQPDEPFLQSNPQMRAIPYVRLTFADTGHGMDAATLARIFDPFFTTKPVGKGTGLGLAMVFGIVKAHDGVIAVASQPGQGTTFRLYFPAQTTTPPPPAKPKHTLLTGQGQTILMVDDEAALTRMYPHLLKALKYQCAATELGREAIAWVRENPARFDLVVTDLNMPDLDGLEVARQIHALQPKLPIILATGLRPELTPEELAQAGICEIIEKPITPSELAVVLHRVLHPA